MDNRKRRAGRWLAAGVILAAGIAGGVTALTGHFPGSAPDYRDPVRLARAVQAAHGGTGSYAACTRLAGDSFTCAVALPGGAEGIYQVTVSPDGRSWQAR